MSQPLASRHGVDSLAELMRNMEVDIYKGLWRQANRTFSAANTHTVSFRPHLGLMVKYTHLLRVFSKIINYLLGTGRATARQPNIRKIPQSSLYSWTMYINKNKVLPPYINSLATRWLNTGNSTSSFLIQPYSIPAFLATAVFYLLKSPLILDIHQLFLLDCVGLYL